MRAPLLRSAFILAVILTGPSLASAQKLDKEDRKFLDDVRPILLAEEDKTYKSLKEKSDRLEFQKIFWARRDPDLATPANEYQAEYERARAEADRVYRLPAQAGSLTDCGRVFILLGKPDEVQQEGGTLTPGLRTPEIWTYRDRPGRTFTGGKAAIAFDEECRAPGALAPQMDRVAGSLVVQPSLDYKKGKDGRLVKLADMLPKDTPARALYKQPRQDFPTALQAAYLKIADGGTALLGLVRGEAAGLAVSESGGTKTVRLSVGASAVAEDGKESGWTEQATVAPIEADGSFVASFKLALRPGKYTLKAGAVDEKGGKGSLASMPIEVPDLAKVESGADGTVSKLPSAGSLLIVKRIEEMPGGVSDPQHPFAAFELGTARLVPTFGGIAHASEQVEFVYQVYDLKIDPVTGKADASAVVSILKDGKTPVAKAPPKAIESERDGASVGPIPLANFGPGKYVVQLKVTDKLGKHEVVQEAPLEVLP
ncbi:MAG TPA: GWxTD domain-containing protein [Vicinamibacteria bacterium]|nr:GWxTD domain-containing protein [Vicinamibacteria bacterium]